MGSTFELCWVTTAPCLHCLEPQRKSCAPFEGVCGAGSGDNGVINTVFVRVDSHSQ